MAIKVAINGFGRIGRLAFRKMYDDERFEIVAINSSKGSDVLSHLLKYDSCHGNYKICEIVPVENGIQIGDKVVKCYAEKDPQNLPWKDLGIDVVLECTGKFKDPASAGKHITAGAKKVIVSAPGKEMKNVVFGVNEKDLDGSEKVISAASCTTNCLAPVAKVLDDNFGIKMGYMTTVHAYTNDQLTLDKSHKDLRRARAAAINIIPTTTGAATAVGKVLPQLKGKLDGFALRVPVATGSLVDLTCELGKKVTPEEVNEAFMKAKSEVVGVTNDPIVSSDIIGMSYGTLVDMKLTDTMEQDGKQLTKVVAWYDNEMSYTVQLVRLCAYFAQL